MKFLYEWVDNTKRTVEVLTIALVTIYLLPLISQYFDVKLNSYFGLILKSLTILVPFCILVTVITSNNVYKKLLSIPWSKSIISIALVTYAAMSNVWASTVINEIYGISANNFAITQTFLTLAFFVVTIMKWFFNGLFITVIIGSIIMIWFLLSFGGTLKSTAVKVLYCIVGSVLIVATHSMVNRFDSSIEMYTKRIAGWGDFYSKNRCNEDYGNNGGVIFLSSGKVLILKERVDAKGKIEQYYPIKDCTL